MVVLGVKSTGLVLGGRSAGWKAAAQHVVVRPKAPTKSIHRNTLKRLKRKRKPVIGRFKRRVLVRIDECYAICYVGCGSPI